MRWIQKPTDQSLVDPLTAALRSEAVFRGTAPAAAILAPLLVRRGISDPEAAQRFLSPSLSHLHAPELMAGLRTAVWSSNDNFFTIGKYWSIFSATALQTEADRSIRK